VTKIEHERAPSRNPSRQHLGGAGVQPPSEIQPALWKLYDAVDSMYEEGRASRWGDLYQAFTAVRKLKANNSPDETAVDRL
jgi:hypothetical protein